MIKSIVVLCALIVVGDNELWGAEENAVYKELVTQGIKLSNGKTITLPKPVMADGLTVKAQSDVLAKVLIAKAKRNEFERGNPRDWSDTHQVDEKGQNLTDSIGRCTDLYFVAKGKFSTVASDGFIQEQLKAQRKAAASDAKSEDKTNDSAKETKDEKDAKEKTAEDKKNPQAKLEFYTEDELKKRKLSVKDTETKKERFAHAVLTPDDLHVELQLTGSGFGIETRNPESIVIAFKLDPRFNKDPDFPNQSQTAKTDANGKLILDPAKPFSGFAGYAKITKMQGPEDKVFVEYHLVYDEPYEWFKGGPNLATKIPKNFDESVPKFRKNIIEYEKKHPSSKQPAKK